MQDYILAWNATEIQKKKFPADKCNLGNLSDNPTAEMQISSFEIFPQDYVNSGKDFNDTKKNKSLPPKSNQNDELKK